MKILKLAALSACFTLGTLQMAQAEYVAGVQQIVVPSKERGINLDVTVWYPAQSGGKQVMLGDTPFFLGTPAQQDAPIPAKKFPLILLSHGAGIGGNAQAMSWLAAPLAEQGFIVVAPNHPGSLSGNKSALENMKLWRRPIDFTDTLNVLEKEAFFQDHIDMQKVGALGVSMGGYTALAIAGVRIDPKLLAAYCDTDLINPSLCGWIRQSGLDLHKMDLQPAGLAYTDSRIRSVVAVDPGPSDTFEPRSLAGIKIPVDLINLGRPEEVPLTVQASAIAKIIPDARYAVIDDASHFTLLGECKPDVPSTLKARGIDEPFCSDGGGRSRSEIHAQLIDMIAKCFNRTLKAN